MKLQSIIIGKGIWQFEFCGDHIAVARWDHVPRSTNQWIDVIRDSPFMTPKYTKFYLEGTCVDDIALIPYDGPLEIGQSIAC